MMSPIRCSQDCMLINDRAGADLNACTFCIRYRPVHHTATFGNRHATYEDCRWREESRGRNFGFAVPVMYSHTGISALIGNRNPTDFLHFAIISLAEDRTYPSRSPPIRRRKYD